MSQIAFIGLGAMGSRMAAHLLKAGHQLTVYDLVPEATKRLVSSGAKKASSAREAAKGCDFVFTMVRDDQASRKVWLDADDGAIHSMAPGAIGIESSTLTPAWVRELGQITKEAGVDLLEAPVSGSTPQAEKAELVFLVGGDLDTLRRAETLLKVLGSDIQHAGPIGSGTLAKLVTNTLMGVQLTTIAEMIGMLKRQKADPTEVLNAVAATSMWNPHLSSDTKSMLSGNFETHFPIKLLAKDLTYTVETAGGPALVPTVSAVQHVFETAIHQQLGDLNMTAVVKLFDKQ